MKVPKDARKLSRSLFHGSFSNGHLDPAKVSMILMAVAARRPRHALAALKNYERLVRFELARHHAIIESAVPLEAATVKNILRDLKTRFGNDITYETKVTPELLGGLRVQLGSDVWDSSIRGRLTHLQNALSNI